MRELPERKGMGIPCCPSLERDQTCDALDYHFRQVYNTDVLANDRRVRVEVVIHARLERCPGELALGDLVYSTTLLPAERVRLFTADRRTRFSFDSETNISYRHEQTSEERYFMASMDDFMSDLTIIDETRATSTKSGSSEGHGDASGAIGTILFGPSMDVSGSYNAESTYDFLRELRQHAEASHNRSMEATRTANSVSIGEVNTRTHAEGESEQHFESSSRTFSNPNHCHALTFLFYQINKTQTVRLTIESIGRRVIDPAVDTRVTNKPFTSAGGVSAIPAAVLATDQERLEIEQLGRLSVDARAAQAAQARAAPGVTAKYPIAQRVTAEPLPEETRRAALQKVDDQLVAVGLLKEPGGDISQEARNRFSFEIHSSLPTPGVLVIGCLDECNVCEPALQEKIELDLERQKLENELLKRQIELLEQSQEYRCCPAGSEPETNDD